MDPRQVKSKKYSKPKIWEFAEEFREKYIGNSDIPVDIENVAERLGIAIVLILGINSKLGMDGFLSNDMRCLYLDQDLYEDEENRYEPRIRFTIAHELGHYYLHSGPIGSLTFETEEEWIKFRSELPPETTGWFEYQANEFAGRLLVPLDPLISLTGKARSAIIKSLSWNSNPISSEQLANMVAPMICTAFNVSSDVIEIRLQHDLAFTYLGI